MSKQKKKSYFYFMQKIISGAEGKNMPLKKLNGRSLITWDQDFQLHETSCGILWVPLHTKNLIAMIFAEILLKVTLNVINLI